MVNLLTRRTPRTYRVAVAALVGSLIVSPLAGITLATPAAAADAGGTFSTSFESADAQPLASTAYVPSVNVGGKKYAPGSLLGYVDKVTASGENAPNEVAANAADGSSSTKWLVKTTTGWLKYHLSSPQEVKAYRITSANDSASRDPNIWTVDGSNDDVNWTTIDTQSGQSFAARQTTYSYTASNPTAAYSYYRLNITKNNGDSMIQLADWDITDGTDRTADAGPLAISVGSGPVSAPVAKSTVGYTGLKALLYVGSHLANGDAKATSTLYDGLNVAIGAKTRLSYQIMPILETSDLTYPATYAAVDLELSDGTTTSLMSDNTSLTDTNGFGVTARDHGREKLLYGSQWNKVTIDLSSLAGKTITKVLFSYDNPDGTAATAFSGWLDDIVIGDATGIDPSSLTNYVDTRRGTNANGSFSRGNNIPATAMPNGFNFFTPETDASSQSWLYQYQASNNSSNKPTLQGIGISHEPSPWMGDRDQVSVMPTLDTGIPNSTLTTRALAFTHDHETAQPDLYSVTFDNGLKAEVTPTDHAGVYRFTFPDTGGRTVLVDNNMGTSNASLSISADGVLSGWVTGGSGSGVTRMFVSGVFDQTPSAVGTATGRTSAAYARFSTQSVELRIATSFISADQAKKNLDLEVTGKTFDAVRNAARDAWNARLGVIEVPNATDTQKVTLYSNLYRLNLYPNSQSENTGTADNPAWKYASPVNATSGSATATNTNAQINDGQLYVNNGFWDTYRTVWPLYSFLYPDFAEKIVNGFVEQYRAGGWISRWSSPGYSDLMTGTSSDASFAEAYISGAISTKVALDAYDAALKNATVLPTSPFSGTNASAVGRKGLDTSEFLGYTSTATGESVSWGLEGYINDYAIGKMAAKLAQDPQTPAARVDALKDESAYFLKRAEDSVNAFDSSIGFFQGRSASGTFSKTKASYDPTSWGGDYTETDGWNFAFHMPYDVDGLAALYGGQDGLIKKLKEFFSTPETGSYGIHEAKEARDVRMGQFGMSNQVSHHIPYIAAAAGKPSMTQEEVREVLQRLFVGSEDGQGYPGDEDNGEMSSWFIFSALGFYPLALASGDYVIGSPLYDQAVVHHGSATLTINAAGNTKNTPYVSDVKLDGTEQSSVFLPESSLKGNHTLTFTMSDKASSWGSTGDTAKTRTPLADASSDQGSAVLSSDGTNVSALADDNSRTSVTLADVNAKIGWTSVTGQVQVASYTITNGAAATGGTPSSAPSAWKLEGSNDGTTWTTLDERSDQKFAWATQTRPFSVATPGLYQNYQLEITGTSDGTPATIAELELLVDPTSQGDLAIHAQSSAASSGVAYAGGYAVVRGGSSDVSAYQASVDLLDGNGPQAATVTAARLGGVQITLPHTFDAAGTYPYIVTVTVGSGADAVALSTNGTITVKTARSFTDAFDNACLTNTGTAVDCDGNGYGLSKTKLAAANFAQGSTYQVGSTGLSFTLPVTVDGKADNATSNGQVIRLQLGDGATKISFIGFANEGQQSGVGKLTYDDGSTQDVPIAFGDWTSAATTPISGNTIVATITGRQSGASSSDSTKTSVYSTTPLDLKAGAVPITLTLPNLNHSVKQGELHVFAIADNGTPAAAAAEMSVTGASVEQQHAVKKFTADLATVTGGLNPKTVSVYWGDNTPASDGKVSDGVISGSHTYAVSGDYTAVVTVDDGLASKAVQVPITVAPAWAPELKLADRTIDSGSDVRITGTGFKAGESVTVSLSTDPVISTEVTADGDGAISATLSVPKRTADGTYVVTALGARSDTPATADLVVRTARDATTTTLTASPTSVAYGQPVTLTATVSGDVAGAVQFWDGANDLGLSPLTGGKATLVVDSLGTGTHSLKASFSGDSWHAASTSGAVSVTITQAKVTLTAPKLSATKVVWGSTTAVLSTQVTGLTSGSVAFVSGKRTIAVGVVGKTATGTFAKGAIATSVPVGTYTKITAVWAGDANHTAAKSAAGSQKLTVVKAKPASIKVMAGSFKKGARPVAVVLIGKLTNGQWPVGTVKLHVKGHKTVTVKLKASMAGLVTVTLGKSKKSVKVWAEFRPSDTKHVSSITSKKVTLKAR